MIKCGSRPFIDFLRRCFEWVPEQRMTPEEALQHAWVTSRREKASAGNSVDSRRGLLKTQPYHSSRKSEEKKTGKEKFNSTTTFARGNLANGGSVVKKEGKKIIMSLKEKLKTFTTKKIVSIKLDAKGDLKAVNKPKINGSEIMIQRSNKDDKVKQPATNQTKEKLKQSNIF